MTTKALCKGGPLIEPFELVGEPPAIKPLFYAICVWSLADPAEARRVLAERFPEFEEEIPRAVELHQQSLSPALRYTVRRQRRERERAQWLADHQPQRRTQ